MSKSLSNYLLPGAGIATLAMGLGFGMASRDHGAAQIENLTQRLALVETRAEAARTSAARNAEVMQEEFAARIAEIQASVDLAAAGGPLSQPAPIAETGFGLGRTALPEEIAAWDVDVLPDGRGLPEGRGDVLTGEEVFADRCASCHGDFAEGVDNWPVLAGGFDTLADKDPVKTVGSYWPYLSTVWDYVHRSMPFGEAQTLSDDETYAIVAYILYSNDLVDEDFELSHENFAEFQMHNREGFILDDRPSAEYQQWRSEPCMENCKDSVEITMKATVLDVTPDVVEEAETEAGADPQVEEVQAATLDAALVAQGEKVFRKCKSCHEVGEGAKNKTGPHLNGIVGRVFAATDGFKYSNPMKAGGDEGRVWDAEALDAFLAKPKDFLKGTRMSFSGLKKEADRVAILEYLRSVSQ